MKVIYKQWIRSRWVSIRSGNSVDHIWANYEVLQFRNFDCSVLQVPNSLLPRRKKFSSPSTQLRHFSRMVHMLQIGHTVLWRDNDNVIEKRCKKKHHSLPSVAVCTANCDCVFRGLSRRRKKKRSSLPVMHVF